MRYCYYVGITPTRERLVFSIRRSGSREIMDTDATQYGKSNNYTAVIGPHQLKRGAEYMAANPFCSSASDADRIVRTKK